MEGGGRGRPPAEAQMGPGASLTLLSAMRGHREWWLSVAPLRFLLRYLREVRPWFKEGDLGSTEWVSQALR